MFELQVIAQKINWLPYNVVNKKGEEVVRFKKLGYNIRLNNGFIVSVTLRQTGTIYSVRTVGSPPLDKLGNPLPTSIIDKFVIKDVVRCKPCNEAKFRATYAHCKVWQCVEAGIALAEAEQEAKRAA